MTRGNRADEGDDQSAFQKLFPEDPITPKQLDYIKSLCIKLGVPIDPNLHSISKSEASAIIDELKAEELRDRDFRNDYDGDLIDEDD